MWRRAWESARPRNTAARRPKWIAELVRLGFCLGCGTCAGVCPAGAIEILRQADGTFVPAVTYDRCTGCRLCETVCPAREFNPAEFEDLFRPEVRRSVLIGRYLEVWTGYAADQALRYEATSGGIATALLCHALRSHMIDSAIVVRMSANSPLLAEAFVAETEETIRTAIGSKYLPVPLNLLLRQVLANPGRYAVVGLPCHVRGLRMAINCMPKLRERIHFVIGLTCAHTLKTDGIRYILRTRGIDEAQVRALRTWGAGWPGGMTIELKDGRRRFLPRLHSLFADVFGSHLYTPGYCLHCTDLACELADVVLADAWLPALVRTDRRGTSLVMARTERGRDLIGSACAAGAIILTPSTSGKFIQAQRPMLYFKKQNIAARRRLSHVSSKDRTRLLRPRPVDYLMALYPLLSKWLAKSRVGRHLVSRLPAAFVRLSRTAYKLASFAASRGIARHRGSGRVLITNQHTDNRGDQAAVYGVLASLRRLLDGYQYTVLVQSPETEPLPQGQSDVRCTGMLTSYRAAAKALLYVGLGKLGLSSRWLLRGEAGSVLRAYDEAELVISAPGGPYIGDLYAGHEHAHLFHIWLAQALGKPTVLYAPSAGPFTMAWRNPFRRALLAKMDVICVREAVSREHLIRLGVSADRIEVVPDAALSYPIARYEGELGAVLGREFTDRLANIGFTPCQWRYPGDPDPEARQSEYVEAVARVLDRCVEQYDANIVAFPQLFGRHTDLPFIGRIGTAMKHRSRFHTLPPDQDCLRQQAVLGRMDLFIATRYHSQIFAAKMGVPSLCIAYEHKAQGFMELLGLEEYVLDIAEVSEAKLWEAVSRLWNTRQAVRAVLARRMPGLAEAAGRAAALCVQALSSAAPRQSKS